VLEPSILMVPESCSSELPLLELLPLLSSSPQAATPSASAARQKASGVVVLTK
jgi:hypothetical protein